MKNVLEKRLSPLIKYPGGKEKELSHILPALPSNIDCYYEPFVGGGAVYFTIEAQKYYINDKSDNKINVKGRSYSWNLMNRLSNDNLQYLQYDGSGI